MEPSLRSPRHPYLAVIGVTLGLVIVLGIAGTAFFFAGITQLSPVVPVYLILAALIAVLATRRRAWGALGFTRPTGGARRLAVVYALPVIAMLVVAVGTGGLGDLGAGEIVAFAGFAALVAFVEEVLFRSLFVGWLLPRGRWVAVGVSSLAFALSHAINVLGGADIADTALQILYALVFGVVAALTLIMVRSILPLIALHCANDFINFIGARQEVSPVDYLVVGIFVGACVLLVVVLRRDGSENARRTTGGSATSASSTVASQNSAVR